MSLATLIDDIVSSFKNQTQAKISTFLTAFLTGAGVHCNPYDDESIRHHFKPSDHHPLPDPSA